MACVSCRKQKRKCNKALPACALCERMNRHCDYSDASPAPTSEEFNALSMKVIELESRLNGNHSMISPPTTYRTPSSTAISAPDSLGAGGPSYNHPQDYAWQGLQNKFPAIAVLDKETFKDGGYGYLISQYQGYLKYPYIAFAAKDVLEHLGDGNSVTAIANEYFATVHLWMPIVSQKRLMVDMRNPHWEAGPDFALLLLCMKLIISRPPDSIESYQTLIYVSAKRFIAMAEASGTVSLFVLQAGLLITWYEYGQAIYPAAWMSAGWCVRYGNLLGINGHSETLELLGRPSTWTELEERRRTWWGVLITDKIVSIGSQGHILTNQEPNADTPLPVNDSAWEQGELSLAVQRLVSNPLSDAVEPFPRLCQASILVGKVLNHHHGTPIPSDVLKFGLANQLYIEISILARKLNEEAENTQDFLSLTAPLSLTYSTLCVLCEEYSCPAGSITSSPEAAEMQIKAIDGLKTVAGSIVAFADRISLATQNPQDLDRLSPIIMECMYTAAANYAWLVRESGDESYQIALDSLRHCLRKFGTRWRNAAEYLRILEAKEFTYAVGSAAS
ncbi:Transcription factor BOA15 [Hyphodiscus hymeniophilus]|uniref:Transcription factor BOA15 n=1 Tax=Hyphodiscus hymeniophilus TaxID=353542 RepID=A0A9P6SNJ8_9HELO|nr:Transcription factor BOA15 [Hyphodiscus hymeniophilus]